MRFPLTGQADTPLLTHIHSYILTLTWNTLKTTAPYSQSHTYTFNCSHTRAFSHLFIYTHIHSYILKRTHTHTFSHTRLLIRFHTHLHTHTHMHLLMAFSGSTPNLSSIAWHSPWSLIHSSPGVLGPPPCQFSGVLWMHKPIPNKIRVPIVLSQPIHLYSWICSISPPEKEDFLFLRTLRRKDGFPILLGLPAPLLAQWMKEGMNLIFDKKK